MRIQGPYTRYTAVSRVRKRRIDGGVSSPTAVDGFADSVQLSATGREVQHARALAFAAPDIRAELVDGIVTEIREGRYRVRGHDVAPRLLQEHQALATL